MTDRAEGRSLELYFVDGKPDGMLTAKVFNWTGHVLMAPRTQIRTALSREEARYTGVYILLGERDGEPFAYIGEGEDISDRIRNHDTNKDWWTSAVLVTSAADNLNKAHVKYLEARLVEEARGVGRVTLENGTTPTRPGLSEADQANMEAFLDYLLMVVPALRIDMFIRNTRPTQPVGATSVGPVFELVNLKHGLKATAVLQDGEFVVEAGSIARSEWHGKGNWDNHCARLLDQLKKTGVLQLDGQHCVFTQNYAFNSPSAAATVVSGRPAGGPVEWKVKGTRQTYKDWEAAQLAHPEGEPL